MSVAIIVIPIIILAALLCIAIPIFLGVFVYGDAKSRGMEPLLWALIAVLAPSFIGLIIYLVVRRNHIVLSCPNCGGDVQENFASCPNCGQKLSASCNKCGTALRPEWKLCPQCGTEITEIGEFTPPVVNKGSNNKKLIGVVVAILLTPVVIMVIAICGFVGFRTSSAVFGVEDITNEIFGEQVHYTEYGILTVSESDLGKEAEDWAAKCKSGKKGVYSKTFYKSEDGKFSSYLGSGVYDMTYAYTVVVINDDNDYIDTWGSLSHYGDAEFLISEEISQCFTEVNAYCDDLRNSPTAEEELVEEYVESTKKSAKKFGNVFVMKFPYSYNIDFNFKTGNFSNMEAEIESESLDIILKDKTDLTYDTGGITYTIPFKGEYYYPIKQRTITETITDKEG